MQWNWKRVVGLSVSSLMLLGLSGCGTTLHPTKVLVKEVTPTSKPLAKKISDPVNIPPFQNELKDEVVPLDTKFDPVRVSKTLFDHIDVVNAEGKKVVLNASQTPVLFEAYWCPHCQRTIKMLAEHWSSLKNKPIFISTGFPNGTPLSEAVMVSRDEMRFMKVPKPTVYYLIGSSAEKYISIIPDLVFERDRQLWMLNREHIFPIWQKALSF